MELSRKEKFAETPELETSENLRLMISLCDSAENLKNKLEKLNLYLSKYLPLSKETQQEKTK